MLKFPSKEEGKEEKGMEEERREMIKGKEGKERKEERKERGKWSGIQVKKNAVCKKKRKCLACYRKDQFFKSLVVTTKTS